MLRDSSQIYMCRQSLTRTTTATLLCTSLKLILTKLRSFWISSCVINHYLASSFKKYHTTSPHSSPFLSTITFFDDQNYVLTRVDTESTTFVRWYSPQHTSVLNLAHFYRNTSSIYNTNVNICYIFSTPNFLITPDKYDNKVLHKYCCYNQLFASFIIS